jgi:CRP-like cAMP-binding protein
MDLPVRPPDRVRTPPVAYFDLLVENVASQWSRRDLSNRAKIVLAALAIVARGRSRRIKTTQREVARACGISSKAAQLAIAELAEQSVISWESIGSNNSNKEGVLTR